MPFIPLPGEDRPQVREAGAAVHSRILVLGLSLGQLVAWGSLLYSFSVFLDPVEAALGMSRTQVSLAFSLALLVEGMVAFRVGRWIDAGHERVLMTAGSIWAGTALIAHGFVHSATGFYLAWASIGLAMGATLYTPVFAVVTRRFPASYRQAIIVITFLGGLASTVFIPLTDWLIRTWDWRVASWVLGAANLVLCAPLHLWLLRNAPRPVRHADAALGPTTHGTLMDHLRSPVYWRLGAFMVLLLAVTAAVPPHLVSLLRESGLPPAWAIVLPASIGALQVLGRIVLHAGDRWLDVDATNRWAPALIPLALFALVAGQGWWLAVLAFALLYGIGNGMLTIVRGTVLANYVSTAQVGALNGALGVPLALARAAAPLLVGLLWTPAHGYAPGLVLLLALALLGVFMLWEGQRRALAARNDAQGPAT